MVDIPRPSNARKRRLRRALYAAVALAVLTLITVGVARLTPAAPGVVRSTVLTDTVKRGWMLRQVRGIGTLVPEEVRVIAASTEGRVERIFAEPGQEVTA